MKITWVGVIVLIAAGFALSTYYYQEMPERMPSHWSVHGEIDGYLHKDIALFLMPLLSVFLAFLFVLLPKIDPLQKNYVYFKPYFEGLIVLLVFFFFYLHVLMIIAGLGFEIQMNYLLVPALSLLFIYISLLLRKAKRNWFVGIRTPWTLSSDSVWEKTHRLASYSFLLLGIALVLLVFVPECFAFPYLLGLIFFFSFMPVFYSFFLWRREQRGIKR